MLLKPADALVVLLRGQGRGGEADKDAHRDPPWDFPPDGLDYHVCFGSDGNLRVSEIWDSREQLEAFGERLMPLLAEVGIEPGEPELIEIHNIVKR